MAVGQTKDRKSEDALVDITLLKRLVKDQEKRISDLEKTVKALQQSIPAASAGANVARPAPTPEERAKPVVKPPVARWHDPLNWSQIREGLSRAQVEEILGKPTTIDSVIDFQTMVYKGDVPGVGMLSGTIKLTDDRVSEVNPPNF